MTEPEEAAPEPSGPKRGLPPKRPEADVAKLAQSFVSNNVWILEHMSYTEIQLSFGLLLSGGIFDDYYPIALRHIMPLAVVGEDFVFPRGINGLPMFGSLQIWRRTQVIEARNRARSAMVLLGQRTEQVQAEDERERLMQEYREKRARKNLPDWAKRTQRMKSWARRPGSAVFSESRPRRPVRDTKPL